MIDQRRIDPERLARAFAPAALRRFLSPRTGERDEPPPVVDRDAVRDMLNRYDADVATADREVGRIVAALRDRGLLDRSIVVVTADHGQSLGQHDWLPHGRITDDNLQVPLIVRFPPGVVRAPLRVARVMSLVDVLPTVLARFDGEASRRFLEQAEGEDALAGGPPRGWALAQRTGRERAGLGERRRVRAGDRPLKLVRRAGGGEELYDLTADPGERDDVSAGNAHVIATLRRTLDDALGRRHHHRRTSRPNDEAAGARRTDRGAAQPRLRRRLSRGGLSRRLRRGRAPRASAGSAPPTRRASRAGRSSSGRRPRSRPSPCRRAAPSRRDPADGWSARHRRRRCG